jgi:hypothetical protein
LICHLKEFLFEFGFPSIEQLGAASHVFSCALVKATHPISAFRSFVYSLTMSRLNASIVARMEATTRLHDQLSKLDPNTDRYWKLVDLIQSENVLLKGITDLADDNHAQQDKSTEAAAAVKGLAIDLNGLGIQPQQVCNITSWQNTKIRGLYSYTDASATLPNVYQWTLNKFGKVIPSSNDFDIRIYYLQQVDRWSERIKLDTDEKLRTYLQRASQDLSLQSRIMVSVEKGSPTKEPREDEQSTMSDLSSRSRGSVQGNFHQRVLLRDSCACVFCGASSKATLRAAHIYDVFRASDIPTGDHEFLRQFEIIDIYDTSNGITLCCECHDVFDALLCCVDVVVENGHTLHKILVANALKQCPEYADKWSSLDGKNVRTPGHPVLARNWPPTELFKFRKGKFDEYAEKRRQLAKDLPNVCKCGTRTKSLRGLASHMRSKACLEKSVTKSNHLSALHTPAAASSKKNQRRAPAKALFTPDAK